MAKVEYMAPNTPSCKATWLCKLIAELIGEMLELIVICYDNQSYIELSENLVFNNCASH